jgi:hypothetical protein
MNEAFTTGSWGLRCNAPAFKETPSMNYDPQTPINADGPHSAGPSDAKPALAGTEGAPLSERCAARLAQPPPEAEHACLGGDRRLARAAGGNARLKRRHNPKTSSKSKSFQPSE